ncbi:hypothetical protein F2Q69_00036004 [Brassica cretica]|uniref:Uncharacterized protein n=1 Tax=Brassica cretica TaxID=69181 RepID=A0A8S9SCJ3_BRACR|nr:hypothetical protein F2Q69_00036004 [Brassica cretica]
MFLGIFIGKFRGNEPSENSEEQVPRYIPRNESLGIFRGTCPSGEIAGDIVGEKGEIAGEERGAAQRKKREMGKKKRLVVIKPRV